MKPIQIKLSVLVASLLLQSGCATLSRDGDQAAVMQLIRGKTAGVEVQVSRGPTPETNAAVTNLLKNPITEESAVRIALLNSPSAHALMAELQISDADRVQAGRLLNPHFSIGRLVEGDLREIERTLRFDVIGLIALPWRSKWQSQQHELAKLQAAQDMIQLAANTRKAWIHAVAAQQTALYMEDARLAAQAGGELARRMARVGNWSKLEQAREQLFLADATAQLARSQQSALSERERLIRLLGLWGQQTTFKLAERLPDLPKVVLDLPDVEARALRERLDVRSIIAQSSYVAESFGMVRASGFVNALELGYSRGTTVDSAAGTKESGRRFELELPIPVFDWGSARNARTEAVYAQSVARVRETAVRARSEAREAYHGYRTAYDLAVHYRDEIVPLRKFISDEVLLRYNGMLVGVFDLLGDMRKQIAAVNSAIEAHRDFWLADTDLQTTLNGSSPGMFGGRSLAGGSSNTQSSGQAEGAH
jgi:outer membrane protein, multidrug efflux system